MTQEEFIRIHRNDDIRQLALKARPEGIDLGYAVEQIAGWQAACRKLPTWAATEGIVFPLICQWNSARLSQQLSTNAA